MAGIINKIGHHRSNSSQDYGMLTGREQSFYLPTNQPNFKQMISESELNAKIQKAVSKQLKKEA